MDSNYLATNETYQKFQIVEDMIWIAKVFGSVISVGSGQVAKALKWGFLLTVKRFLFISLPPFDLLL